MGSLIFQKKWIFCKIRIVHSFKYFFLFKKYITNLYIETLNNNNQFTKEKF